MDQQDTLKEIARIRAQLEKWDNVLLQMADGDGAGVQSYTSDTTQQKVKVEMVDAGTVERICRKLRQDLARMCARAGVSGVLEGR